MRRLVLESSGRNLLHDPVLMGEVNSRDTPEHKCMEVDLGEIRRHLAESRERERLQLAQELHDVPLQELYVMQLELHELVPALKDASSLSKLAAVRGRLDRTIGILRAICKNLRPPALDEFGLVAAIQTYAEQFQAAYPALTVELNLEPEQRLLPPWMALALFRICHQALNNSAKHAAASRVWVHLQFDEEQVVVEIRDNGRGFVLPSRWVELVHQDHFGIAGMIERAKGMGGDLMLDSAPGQGTTVCVTVPRPASSKRSGR